MTHFIFAGEPMSRGSVSLRLVEFVRSPVSRMPGTLGVTTAGTATVFGTVSGSSAAAVVSVGKVVHPTMTREVCPASFSASTIESVSAIGIVIPPSIPTFVDGAPSETSIPRHSAAGILPGLLLALLLAAFVMVRARSEVFGTSGTVARHGIAQVTRRAAGALGAPAIVPGGTCGGVVSPIWGAAVASVSAVPVTLLVSREQSLRDILDAAIGTPTFAAQILVIVSAAGLFSCVPTVTRCPDRSWPGSHRWTSPPVCS